MEKYSQFRDRATGISPFLPVSTPLSIVAVLTHAVLFTFRLPFFLTYSLSYFLLAQALPLPVVARKIALWGMLAIPGIWWVDLQLDGVRRGTLADQPPDRFPHPGSIIAANFTSPIDAVYLAAIFDPIFTISYPGTKDVQRVGLFRAICMALTGVQAAPAPNTKLVSLKDLLAEHPHRIIAVFPECGTTNGKAILPFSPSLLYTPPNAQIFPVSLRYTPADVTTPVPGQWLRFLWNLLSRPTICIRVRVAEGQIYNTSPRANGDHDPNVRQRIDSKESDLAADDERMLGQVGEALARLGRVKRVGLTMKDKADFVRAYSSRKA